MIFDILAVLSSELTGAGWRRSRGHTPTRLTFVALVLSEYVPACCVHSAFPACVRSPAPSPPSGTHLNTSRGTGGTCLTNSLSVRSPITNYDHGGFSPQAQGHKAQGHKAHGNLVLRNNAQSRSPIYILWPMAYGLELGIRN